MYLSNILLSVIRTNTNSPCEELPGTWSQYSHFSVCSVTCGSGTKFKTRTCLTGSCRGEAKIVKLCKKKKCPSEFKWKEWSEFSRCSRNCGGQWLSGFFFLLFFHVAGGTKVRTRECEAGKNKLCDGNPTDTARCNVKACPLGEMVDV